MKQIIQGHKYLCKKSVIGCKNKVHYYLKGKIYESEYQTNDVFGFITDEFGEKYHSWPVNPATNPVCSDKWTDYFVEVK